MVDPEHPRFGQIAEITDHDWLESGDVYLVFPGGPSGEEAVLKDGLMSNEPTLPQVLIFKRSESEKALAVQRGLSEIRWSLREICPVAGNPKLSLAFRLAAKEEFRKLCLEKQANKSDAR